MFKKTLLGIIVLSSLTSSFLCAKSDPREECFEDCVSEDDRCFGMCYDALNGTGKCLWNCARFDTDCQKKCYDTYYKCVDICDELVYECQAECNRQFPRKNKDKDIDTDETEVSNKEEKDNEEEETKEEGETEIL